MLGPLPLLAWCQWETKGQIVSETNEEKWSRLCKEAYAAGVKIDKDWPYWVEFAAWALNDEAKEVLIRRSMMAMPIPANRLINRATMRELSLEQSIQVGDIIHWRRGDATLVTDASGYVGLTGNRLWKKPIKVWRKRS